MPFEKDDILEVAVASRSHVVRPYYVLVISGGSGLETHIPGLFKRSWHVGDQTWHNYHKSRLKKVGTFKTHSHLLYNQEVILNGEKLYSADNPRGAQPKTTDTTK